jgi:NAD(P)-dependent dehydrogenase (short-subunit alcohol dehydrogenase family)
MEKTAVVTGAARGLGWGTAQALAREGYLVLLLGRDAIRLGERKREIESAGGKAEVFALDLGNRNSIADCAAAILKKYSRLDLLVNNAGVFLEKEGGYHAETVQATLQTNALGPLEFSQALAPALIAGHANVVNVSSGMGSLREMNGGFPGYRISKTALNAVTRYLSEEWKGKVRVNSVCPGWVRTEMGGPGADRSLEEGVASILWAARLGPGGPSGGFFRDGKALDW